MALVELVSTSRVAAEATVERLQALEIDAQILHAPNLFVKLSSGGNYRVRVLVPEEELERARAELATWEREAAPRLRVLQREVVLGLLGSFVPPALLALLLFTRQPVAGWAPGAVIGTWVGSVFGWVAWSRLRARAERR